MLIYCLYFGKHIPISTMIRNDEEGKRPPERMPFIFLEDEEVINSLTVFMFRWRLCLCQWNWVLTLRW